ncbi:MAG: queuosine precursor transporter [Verrucomicrobia bacterium]|nr:queuosine precursor transporter [Verrucomicrobiota bacterium]NDE62906.1 VUT family protein [Chlamydiota bacterium]
MSEIVFILHLVTLIFLGLVALRLGKETLTAFSALQAILANLFIQKQTYLFGLEVTCTDAYAILSLFSLNLVQEYFGKDAAKRVIKINFFLLLTFAIMAKIHLLYPPSLHDETHSAFFTILENSPRTLLASFTVFFLVQKLDVRFFTKLRNHFFPNSLPFSILTSLLISQTIDTILFSCFALWGIAGSILEVIVMSLIVKYFVIFFMTPFSKLTKRLVPA